MLILSEKLYFRYMGNPLIEYEMLIEHGGIDECYTAFLKRIDQLRSQLNPMSISSKDNGFTNASKNTYLLSGVRNVFEQNNYKDGDEVVGPDDVIGDEDYEAYIYL